MPATRTSTARLPRATIVPSRCREVSRTLFRFKFKPDSRSSSHRCRKTTARAFSTPMANLSWAATTLSIPDSLLRGARYRTTTRCTPPSVIASIIAGSGRRQVRHKSNGWFRRCLFVMTLVLRCAPPAWAADADTIVDRASRQVTAFLDQMSDVQCSGDELLLNESRLSDEHKEQRNKKNVPLLITNGFSMLMLIFHPYYRNSFEFSAMPDEIIAGHRTAQVRFTHIPGTRTPAALAVRGREFPLELTGTAWIEPETGQVVKLKIGLAKDMSDVGLKSLTAEIDYDPIHLPGWTQAYRFPAVATVEVETLRQRWRNVHRFSNYKRFLVDTSVTVVDPEQKK